MRAVSRRMLARTFVTELLKAPLKQGQLARSLAAYLIETKQTKVLDMVIADIEKELMAQGYVTAKVISARSLSDAVRQAITDVVRQATKAQTIELEETINPELIGGMQLRLPSYELDATVRHQLQQLRS